MPVNVKIVSKDNKASNGARVNAEVNIDNGNVTREEEGNTFENAELNAQTFIKDGNVEIDYRNENLIGNAQTSREVKEKTETQEQAEVGAKTEKPMENEPDLR